MINHFLEHFQQNEYGILQKCVDLIVLSCKDILKGRYKIKIHPHLSSALFYSEEVMLHQRLY